MLSFIPDLSQAQASWCFMITVLSQNLKEKLSRFNGTIAIFTVKCMINFAEYESQDAILDQKHINCLMCHPYTSYRISIPTFHSSFPN